jgi:hypothetical protein
VVWIEVMVSGCLASVELRQRLPEWTHHYPTWPSLIPRRPCGLGGATAYCVSQELLSVRRLFATRLAFVEGRRKYLRAMDAAVTR